MQQHETERRNLIERLDTLAEEHGQDIAQSYIASGDPDDEPLDLTFAEFVAQSRRRANALCAIGVAREVVAFAAPLSETSYPTMTATMAAATYAPINYFLEIDALVRIIRASGAKILLFHRRFDDGPDIVGKLARVGEALPHVRLVSFGTGESVDGVPDLESIAAGQSPFRWDASALEDAENRLVALFHTGGTTGLPKLVPHTESMYDAMIDQCGAGEGAARGETIISGLPLFHTSGALQAGLVPLMNGARLLIPSSRGFRDPKVIANHWRFARRFGISYRRRRAHSACRRQRSRAERACRVHQALPRRRRAHRQGDNREDQRNDWGRRGHRGLGHDRDLRVQRDESAWANEGRVCWTAVPGR